MCISGTEIYINKITCTRAMLLVPFCIRFTYVINIRLLTLLLNIYKSQAWLMHISNIKPNSLF